MFSGKFKLAALAAIIVLALGISLYAFVDWEKDSDESSNTGQVSDNGNGEDELAGQDEDEQTEGPQSAVVQIDYSLRSDPPLLKKIGQYNAGIPPIENYERDLGLLEKLNSHSFRLDLGMGAEGFIGENVVTGSLDQLEYRFDELDLLATWLNDMEVVPYYSWAYVPKPLQRDNDFRKLNDSTPDWQLKWQEMMFNVSKHFVDEGIRVGYHEIYNEPDLQDLFFLEPYSKYLELYKYGSRGIKQGNPDAMIGGPAAAFPENKSNVMDFLKLVDAEDLPLDFFSFHHYWTAAPFWSKLTNVRQILEWYERFDTTEIHVNELSYVNGWQDKNSLNNYYGIAPKMFDVFAEILNASDITMFHWAQFMESTFLDDAYGIIHRDGRKKAAYNVFQIYSDMPEERVAVDWGTDWESEKAIGVLASGNKEKASIVLWNRQEEDKDVSVQLKDLPAGSHFRLYRIDKENGSYFDGGSEDLIPLQSGERVDGTAYQWEGQIPAGGVVYLTFNADESRKDFAPESKYHFTAKDIRPHYYFENRGKKNYSYFDRKQWRFFLGMSSHDEARSLVGVTAEQMPEILQIESLITGEVNRTAKQAAMYMRIDYMAGDQFAKSVVFHDGLYPAEALTTYPFGTLRAADEAVEVERLQSFAVDLAEYAPEGWNNGRVLLSFDMQNTGQDTRLEAYVK